MTETTDTREVQRELDELCVNTIRTLSIDAVQKANSGHPGAPMGLAPLAYLLYTRVMRHNPADPDWPGRDRFVLSAGHASALLYSMLHLTGYPLTLEEVKHFRQLGAPTAGHPERKYTPGIETTTGPLGQGLATGVGLALGERMMAARFGEEVVGHHTYVIASDGDIQEGVAAEASSLAGHWGLGRLITYYDANSIQLASPVDLVMTEDVGKRYEAYGWHVVKVEDANDLDELLEKTKEAQDEKDRPSLVIVPTHIGYGSPNKQDSPKAHGNPLGEDEVRATKEFYGWPTDKLFYIPDEALEHFRKCCERGRTWQDEWRTHYENLGSEDKELFDSIQRGEMPKGFDKALPTFQPDEEGKGMATRAASGKAINAFAETVPHLVGGSADLASSNNTDIDSWGDVLKDQFDGRNIHFGVREHAMGAIVNGLALQGFRAFGGTFLNFSDYMRGAVRLAALMKLPAIYVWTHDSIGLGEDGPTHQPVEHLAALRAMPRLRVIRPGDANETARAWRFALRETEAPTALALTRQGVPTIAPDSVPDDAIERGAYVLRANENGDEPDVILIATGSEVPLAIEAADKLAEDDVDVRVVSMPCMENFDGQDDPYRESVLPSAVHARVGVEAAVPLGWDRWVGPLGAFVGMRSFGESGPAKEVYAHFGITSDAVVEAAKNVMAKVEAVTGG